MQYQNILLKAGYYPQDYSDRPESYDKLSVVIIALNETMETNDELLGMLNTLFSEQKTYLERKKELEEIYQMRNGQ